MYKYLARTATDNKGDNPVVSMSGLSGMDRCISLLGLVEGAIKNLTDHRRLSASQLVWKAGKDKLSPLLKDQWKVRLRSCFRPAWLLMSFHQAKREARTTSQPFMTYIQNFILTHLAEDQAPDGLSNEDWAEMKDAALSIAELGDNRQLPPRSNAEIDEYVM
jgi:hypothetical protein